MKKERLKRWALNRTLNICLRGFSGAATVGMFFVFRRVKKAMYASGR